jgi:hypothetical protein
MGPLTDANGDGVVNAMDIQIMINEALAAETDTGDNVVTGDHAEIDILAEIDDLLHESDGSFSVLAADAPASAPGDAGEETAIEEPTDAEPIIEGTPVAGALGLGLAAAACALLGMTVSNRKR